MAITIEFVDGVQAGQTLEFDDSIESIAIGRDPERCQVVIPSDLRMVGREHCTISRLRGQYYIEMGADRRVTMDGDLMETSQALPTESVLQIGPNGPQLKVSCARDSELEATFQQDLDEDVVRQRAAAPANVEQVAAVASQAEQSRNVAGIAVAVAIVFLGVGVGLFFLFQGNLEGIESEQAATSESVAAMQGDLASMGEDLSHLGVGMSEALQAATQSTFLVMQKNMDGSLVPFGTAWSFGPGQLATNAHVAEHFEDLESGETILVRCAGGERSYPVREVFIHPGFVAFTELWQDYVPVQTTAERQTDPVRAAGMAADVGLLLVDESADLGPFLSVADASVQEQLKAGDPVGYVGYPVEAMALGGVNVETPVPQIQIGYITAVTNYFNSPSDPADALLIQHSLPATGGASGSPLINAQGEVVGLLSAVNFMVVGGERIPSAIDVNFAQRATLLGELQSEELETLQQARSDTWSSDISRLYASGKLANRSAEINDVVAAWEQMIAAKTNNFVSGSTLIGQEFFPLDSLHIDGFAMGAGDALGAELYGREVELKIEADKQYLLAVEGSGGDVEARLIGEGYEIVDVMNIKPRLKAIAFKASRSGILKAQIGSTEPSGTLGYELRSATIPPRTPESVVQAAVDRWLEDLKREGRPGGKASRVRQWSGQINDRFTTGFQAMQNLELSSAGSWFVIAVCPQFRNINLELRNQAGEVMAVDEQPDWYPFIAVDAQAAMTLQAVVATVNEGCDYQIHLYRAD